MMKKNNNNYIKQSMPYLVLLLVIVGIMTLYELSQYKVNVFTYDQFISELDKHDVNKLEITAKSGATLKISFAVTINTRYIPACSGWINAFTIYSSSQLLYAPALPPFPAIGVLVAEYVIVINGDITIKNPIPNNLNKYIKKNLTW